MKHLSDDRLLALAQRILSEEDLSYREELEMEHISCCDECYELLRCTMAMLEVTDHMDLVMHEPVQPAAETSAVIRVVILSPAAILQQLQAQQSRWVFEAPPPRSFAATRSAGEDTSGVTKLQDIDNSRTYVAYDAGKKMLVIQMDCPEGEQLPRVFLEDAAGARREIELEKQERTYWARIQGLEEGEYRLILEK